MFSVYGLNGRVFSGSLDGVRALEPVQAAARVRAGMRVGAVGGAVQGVVSLLGRGGATGGGGLERQLVAAYQDSTAGESRPQPLSVVHQLMSRPAFTVPMEQPLLEAWQAMRAAGRSQAPVLDARGRPVGLLLRAEALPMREGDALELLGPDEWRKRLALPVRLLMWSPVPSAVAETPLRELAQLLVELRLPGVAVADAQGQVEGFISRSDLLRAMTRDPPLDLWS